MPVIPAAREAEIERIMVPSQPGQTVFKTSSQPIVGRGGVSLLSRYGGKVKIEGSWSGLNSQAEF
jgi:hypothetical protein